MTAPGFALRSARIEDAAEIARLSTELDYPASAAEMTPRLRAVLDDPKRHVVAAAADNGLLGWIGLERRLCLEGGERAEIVGLVVDARSRRAGVGATLAQRAERWARELGYDQLVARSNAARIESHPFHEKHGYVRKKTSHLYSKPL